jgi:polar amino acid transport system substrate-binding protein
MFNLFVLSISLWTQAGPLLLPSEKHELPPPVELYLLIAPPLMSGPDGHGIVGDVVLQALKETGINAKIIPAPTARALLMPQRKDNVLVAALARINERENSYTWIAPIYSVKRAFFTQFKKIDTFKEAAKNLRLVAVTRGTASHRLLIQNHFPEYRILEIGPADAESKLLMAGRIDAFFDTIPEGQMALRNIGATNYWVGAPLAETPLYLACSKHCDQKLVDSLRESVEKMRKDGTIKKLQSRYPDAI